MDRFRLMPNYRYYSAEGTSPLSITDSIGKPLRNYRIYGSDGGVGDKSKNLFDNQRAIEYADEVTSYMYSYFKFENGKTYTMSCTSKSEDTTNKKWFRAGTLDTSRITLNTLGYKSVTFTIPNDGVDYYLRVYDNRTPSKLQYLKFFDGTYMENLQIEEGSAATDYESYHKYDVPITVRGKNLLPYPYSDTTKTINGITFTDNGDGTIAASGTATHNGGLRLMNWTTFDKTKKYYISGSPSGGGWSTHGIYISFWLNGTWKKELLEKGNGLLLDLPNMTVEFNQIQINCVVWNGATVENITFKPQLEEGETASEYEPYIAPNTYNIYLDEPLAEGEYIDYINGIGLPRIQTNKGTNIITVDTELKPSKIEVQYYK